MIDNSLIFVDSITDEYIFDESVQIVDNIDNLVKVEAIVIEDSVTIVETVTVEDNIVYTLTV